MNCDKSSGKRKSKKPFCKTPLSNYCYGRLPFFFFCLNSKFIDKSFIFLLDSENTNNIGLLMDRKFMELRNLGVSMGCNVNMGNKDNIFQYSLWSEELHLFGTKVERARF